MRQYACMTIAMEVRSQWPRSELAGEEGPTRGWYSALGNRYLWQGREYSWSTGLYSFRARWYDPLTGRWLSPDPIGISGGLNLYVFCGNDPVNNRDPWGLCDALSDYANSIPAHPWQNLNPLNRHFLLYKGVGAVLYGLREFGTGLKSTFAAAKADARSRGDRAALYGIYAVEPRAYFSKGAAERGILAPVMAAPGVAELMYLRTAYGVGQSSCGVGTSLANGNAPASDDVYGAIMPIAFQSLSSGPTPLANKISNEMVSHATLSNSRVDTSWWRSQ